MQVRLMSVVKLETYCIILSIYKAHQRGMPSPQPLSGPRDPARFSCSVVLVVSWFLGRSSEGCLARESFADAFDLSGQIS
jgi:hypothetical protein